ncbi:MAG: O-antigen ligase family protein, partial [Thermoleophilia bacterium]|nr:O-antigen ligase family protein [Thermoleophilia bacterium]
VLSLWHSGLARRDRVRDIATACLPLAALLLYLCSSCGSIVAAVIGVLIVVALGPTRKAFAGSLVLGVAGSIPLVLLASRLGEAVHAGTGGDAVVQGLVLLAATVIICSAVGWARVPTLQRIESSDFNQRTTLRIALGVGVVALVVLIASNPTDRISSFTSIPVNGVESDGSTYATQHLLSESGNGRWQLWETSLDAFRDEPLRGIGSGGFEAYFKVNGSFWMKTIDPHSTPFEFLAELGLVGFLLLAGVTGFALVAGIRRYRSLGVSLNAEERNSSSREEIGLFFALFAIGIFGVSIDWTGELPVIFGAMMVFLAALAGPLYAAPARQRRRASRSSVLPVVAVVASMLVAGVIIVASARQYEASRSIAASRSAFESGDGQKALDEAEQAISATPWAAATYAQLASVQEKTGNRGAALASAEEATVRASQNDGYWLLLGQLQQRDGLTTPAVLSILTAQALNPNSNYWTDKNVAKQAKADGTS